MFINKKLINLAVCLTLTTFLGGCGTILRLGGGFDQGTYQAVNTDIDIIHSAWMWYLSLGIIPVVAMISLPFDAVVDTALLPIDASVESAKWRKFDQQQKEEQRQKDLAMQEDLKTHVYLKVYAINLTGNKEIDESSNADEKFKYKPIESIEIKQAPDVLNSYKTEYWRTLSKDHIKLSDGSRFAREWTQDTQLEVSWKIRLNYTYVDNPHKIYSREWYDWQRNAIKRNKTVNIPSYDDNSSITLIFLPCDQLAVSTTLTPDNYQAYLDRPSFKKELAQLNKRQTEYQCAQK